jgi:toxin ParE1/3/4
MSAKPVVRRAAADGDIGEAVDYYAAESVEAADRFIDELKRNVDLISKSPRIGSPRYSHALNIEGLRFQKLGRFPYLIFYVEREDYIDVWRVLHEHRDIPNHLQARTG